MTPRDLAALSRPSRRRSTTRQKSTSEEDHTPEFALDYKEHYSDWAYQVQRAELLLAKITVEIDSRMVQ